MCTHMYICLYVWAEWLYEQKSELGTLHYPHMHHTHHTLVSHTPTHILCGNMYVYCIYLMYAPPLLTIHYTCSWYGHNMSNVYTRYPTTNSSQVVSVNVIDMWLPLSPRQLCLSVCPSVHGWHICVLGISLKTNACSVLCKQLFFSAFFHTGDSTVSGLPTHGLHLGC